MLTIRLQRVGRKNDPSFRVILVEAKRAAKTGNYRELLGSYDPRRDQVTLKADRIKYWVGQGVTLSDTVHNLLISQKIIEGKKINVLPAFKAPVAEAPAEAAAVEAAPAEAPIATDEPKGDNAVAEEKAAA